MPISMFIFCTNVCNRFKMNTNLLKVCFWVFARTNSRFPSPALIQKDILKWFQRALESKMCIKECLLKPHYSHMDQTIKKKRKKKGIQYECSYVTCVMDFVQRRESILYGKCYDKSLSERVWLRMLYIVQPLFSRDNLHMLSNNDIRRFCLQIYQCNKARAWWNLITIMYYLGAYFV